MFLLFGRADSSPAYSAVLNLKKPGLVKQKWQQLVERESQAEVKQGKALLPFRALRVLERVP